MTAPTRAPGEYWWHVHHGEGLLFESLTEPAEVRRQYIRDNKPAHEIETRLRLFQPILGDLNPPAYWREAYAKRQEAYAKRQEADDKWREADAKWKASPDWARVEALHKVECPNCPWNGVTIFP